MSKGKRRRAHPRSPEGELGRPAATSVRRSTRRPTQKRGRPWLLVALGGVALLATLSVLAYALGWFPTGAQATGCTIPDARRPSGPPAVAPLANPPAQPQGDETRATIETELGSIVVELFCDSSPVAAQNFVNLAAAGYYDGVVFHRIVPGFVIQGGDPEGTGRGGPGYTIQDEAVVGEYVRGTVAMARTQLPNSQGSQFFIVLDDDVRFQLDKAGGYAIFGRVVEGMDVVDLIAAGPASQQLALEPVAMMRVTVQPP